MTAGRLLPDWLPGCCSALDRCRLLPTPPARRLLLLPLLDDQLFLLLLLRLQPPPCSQTPPPDSAHQPLLPQRQDQQRAPPPSGLRPRPAVALCWHLCQRSTTRLAGGSEEDKSLKCCRVRCSQSSNHYWDVQLTQRTRTKYLNH